MPARYRRRSAWRIALPTSCQFTGARHTASPMMRTVAPSERAVRGVSSRERSEGATVSEGARGDTLRATLSRSSVASVAVAGPWRDVTILSRRLVGAIPSALHALRQRGLRTLAAGLDGARLALGEHPDHVLEVDGLPGRPSGALGRRTAVPLADLEDPLERRPGHPDGAQLGVGGAVLDELPDPTVGAETDLGPQPGAENVAVEEVEGGLVPSREGLGGGRRAHLSDDEQPDRRQRQQGALAVGVDVADLRLDHGQVEADRGGVRPEHLPVVERDHHQGHGTKPTPWISSRDGHGALPGAAGGPRREVAACP